MKMEGGSSEKTAEPRGKRSSPEKTKGPEEKSEQPTPGSTSKVTLVL